ncbi:MAG TPA: methyltransferase domain-containing protein [Chthoniobacterales bacterium]|nr:methyltransferase domain-containing protein [Chthoniobacterales bacterium]
MSGPLVPRISDILACPVCRGDVRDSGGELHCTNCARTFAIQNGIPVFLGQSAEVVAEHTSNAIGPHFEEVLKEGKEFVLHIGAGGSPQRFPNCVEFEYKIFRHTDVVGDAHQLPLKDGVFDRVFALNVFEHLKDPKLAAQEIFRVLKPGGSVAIHTAFLQSVHEEPHHYYNATEYGVREWFSPFEIEAINVTGNFGPGVMLAFLLSNVLEAARASGATWREQMRLSDTTLGEWAEFWAGRSDQPPGFQTLQSMPLAEQKKIAAGFEMIARKPAAISA